MRPCHSFKDYPMTPDEANVKTKNGGKRMNIPKTWVVLLAFLLAARVIVPIVSAERQPLLTSGCSSAIVPAIHAGPV
jgi:hypothetical protein